MADGEMLQDRAKFRAMTEGTVEDWAAIGRAAAPHRSELTNRLIAHLKCALLLAEAGIRVSIMLFTGEDSVADPDDRKPQADKFRDLAGPADVSPSRESTRRWQASQMDQQSFFVLKPSPVVVMPVVADNI
jgi:hypothetical protein